MRFYLLFVLICFSSYSQVGIGTSAPQGALDINSSNNGVVFPRVALTSKNVDLPVVNPNGGSLVIGTIVWNTATSGSSPNNVVPGYYYWNGTQWETFNSTSTNNSSIGTIANNITNITPITNSYTATNSTVGTADISSLNRTVNITGAVGTITSVTCNVKFKHKCQPDVSIYLKSPTNQLLNLHFNVGPINLAATTQSTADITYSDLAPSIVPLTWPYASGIIGTYKPLGDLAQNPFSTPTLTPNITSMAGFNGNSPNGVWTLYFRDDQTAGVIANFTSFTINITTGVDAFRLVGETSITYNAGNSVITNATYSANCSDDYGFITALTRTTSSAGAIGTLTNSLPGTTLSFASDSPMQGTGDYWGSTSNIGVSQGLTNGATYYFQLWSKGNIDLPTNTNESFTLVPFQLP